MKRFLLLIMIACLWLTVHAGPAVTLKRHTHKKASRLENMTPPPVIVSETVVEDIRLPNENNTTELAQRFERINESLQSVVMLVEERILDLQRFIKQSQELAQT